MDELPPAHSFVIKIWAKRVDDATRDASWRGTITHVESGKRQYLESLVEVPRVLAPYVVEAGGTLDLRTRLCLWMVPSASYRRTADD